MTGRLDSAVCSPAIIVMRCDGNCSGSPRRTRGHGAAVTGSAAAGREDRWSDIDLYFGVADDVALDAVLADWTDYLYGELAALHHFELNASARSPGVSPCRPVSRWISGSPRPAGWPPRPALPRGLRQGGPATSGHPTGPGTPHRTCLAPRVARWSCIEHRSPGRPSTGSAVSGTRRWPLPAFVSMSLPTMPRGPTPYLPQLLGVRGALVHPCAGRSCGEHLDGGDAVARAVCDRSRPGAAPRTAHSRAGWPAWVLPPEGSPIVILATPATIAWQSLWRSGHCLSTGQDATDRTVSRT